ncbi:MAG: permease component of ribose/xylose/arabinose/galactoside ABC-type transporter [Chloroflexi bacterium]|jgi:ribose/xylose/arabinose/galactoside ABC-type transport system permease subunit|nr:permease component of ribose/xylose/arabinose/galactoside ABC-type transporter [Chloroflexota bacterium]
MSELKSVENTLASPTGKAPTGPARGNGLKREGLGNFLRSYGALLALLLLVIYNIIFTRNFLTTQTLNVNLTQVATIVIVATGMTLVIATGGIDLSVGSLMAISGALAPLIFLSKQGPFSDPVLGVVAAFIIPVLVAGAFGLFNGSLVTHFKIQPIIATLVLFIAGRGIAQVVTNGNLQTFRNPSFQYIGLGRPFDIPFQVILMLVIVALTAWVMRVTIFGRYVLAVGGNEAAARLSGVPVNRVKLAVYVISGILSGIAGLIVIAINSSSDANLVGQNMELDAIAAVAVGGTPLTGGRVTIFGTLIGALIIQLIRYTLLANRVPDAAALVVKAAIILVAVYIQRPRQS